MLLLRLFCTFVAAAAVRLGERLLDLVERLEIAASIGLKGLGPGVDLGPHHRVALFVGHAAGILEGGADRGQAENEWVFNQR